ncbi:kinetochore-associated Ndc80 complex subunit spc25 [Marasmius sp. AFHP31]|nr:kinetochore-associated Ndc80 complex subunit spc25 [Marasmius sp. AFHP31]
MSQIRRVPQIDLTGLLSQPNPHIDLKLDAYERDTKKFLKAVSTYKNNSIAQISDRRARGAAEKKKLQEKVQAVETETNNCKVLEIELNETLAREQGERREAEASVAKRKRDLAALNDRSSSVDAQIEEYRAIVANLRRERNKERTTLTSHAARISPELESCQQLLACVIEGVEKDQLLIRFTRVDESDLEREFSFILDVSQPSLYKGMSPFRSHDLDNFSTIAGPSIIGRQS